MRSARRVKASSSWPGDLDSASARSALATGSPCRWASIARKVDTAQSTFAARCAGVVAVKPFTPVRLPSVRTTASARIRRARVSMGEAPTGIVRMAGNAVTTSVPAASFFASSRRWSAAAMRSGAGMGLGFTTIGRTSR